jgi:Na+/H+ antiporter NhaD/arsenite permease-like protein
MKTMINYFKVLALGLYITLGLISGNEVLANTSKDNSKYTITEDGASHSIVFFNSTDDPTDGGAVNHDGSHAKDDKPAADAHGDEDHSDLDAHAHAEPAAWSVIPFVLLLLMIATGPLFYAHFWHHHYPKVALILGFGVASYYIFGLHDVHHPVHALAEYASFICLLAALFVASGGILIKVDKPGRPLANVILLIFGAVISNVIGTTGASMLLIRPFIRLNENRIKPFHIVFFIFMVSNVGGSLTPIGDPPLFLGFLKGVDFFWTMENIWMQWIFGIVILAIIFFIVDSKSIKKEEEDKAAYSGKITVKGLKNVLWLAITIAAVFIDPNVMEWVPYIPYEGDKISYIRELIMLATTYFAFRYSDEECLKGNEFDFEPIKEVAYIFIGIFGTMMPALQLIGTFAKSPEGREMITDNLLYWATGALSGVLDNAPTYLNFLSAAMAKNDLDLGSKVDVVTFASDPTTMVSLGAISVAAVFFGAMTYIGNAPNFMVKSIAEQSGIKMPAFAAYVVKYSLPILLPVLFLVWVVFYLLPTMM